MKRPKFILPLFLIFAICGLSAFGNTVAPDTSFNGTGYSIQSVGGSTSALGDSLAIQSDGKIVIGGNVRIDENTTKTSLIRLNVDGTPDTSFGNGGSTLSPIATNSWATKVLLQPDGKILVAHTSVSGQTFTDFTVFRYTTSGELDTTFNSVGYVVTDINDSSLDICLGLALQTDGKIVLVGRTWKFGDEQYDIAAVRLNPNGSFDSTFNSNGIRRIVSSSTDEEAYSVLLQADGKILIGGFQNSTFEKFLLTRLNSDGSTDVNFGTNGMMIYGITTANNRVRSLAQQSDGRILAAGGGLITRISPEGVRDMTFGSNGVATTATQSAPNSETGEMRVLGNDKFVIATRYGVRRFMSNGGIDTNFVRDFHPPNSSCFMSAVSIQNDGKAVLGGYCRNSIDNIYRFAAYRFQENRTKRLLDFDGDELTDISIFRPSNGQWWFLRNLASQTVAGQLGTPTDLPFPADFTGDGKTDPAVFRPSTGEWFISQSENGSIMSFRFGTSEDIPVPSDYDGDNVADAAVFRPSTGVWYILKSTGGVTITTFGLSEDKPVPADYDGDFKTDIAIFRPSTGVWWIQKSSDGSVFAFQFGTSSDKPVQGEYTGDNKTDAAFWRPSTGEWFILRSEDYSYFSLPFGLSDDLPTPGNFTGDGRFDFVVYRPSTNTWHVQPADGPYFYRVFGVPGDVPLPNLFVP